MMNKFPFLTGALALGAILSIPSWFTSPRVYAESAECGCPTASPSATTSGSNNVPNDPAFIMCNKQAAIADIQRRAAQQANLPPVKKPAELVEAEQAHYSAFLAAVKKDASSAFSLALAIWKGNDSADLQKMVIVKALGTVRSTEETDALQFMFKALDEPEAQRVECAKLGRGNSVEKSIAAQRIALLESNPKLRSQPVQK